MEDVLSTVKFGTVLMMDVFTPAKPNGVGLIFVESGGLVLRSRGDQSGVPGTLFEAGLHGVRRLVHGSQPKFNITEILGDIVPCGTSGIMRPTMASIRNGSASWGRRPGGIYR